MISVKEAIQLIEKQALNWRVKRLPLEQALGKSLAINIMAERPQPAFDRATMDGIAINFDALKSTTEFPIQETAKAGAPQKNLSNPNHCLEVMTGAPLPNGADTIIRYEDLDINAGIASLKNNLNIEAGQNIHPEGSDYKAGALLLKEGIKLKAPHLGILASEGHHTVEVRDLNIAVVSTGDELVPVDEIPLPHQIRRSNAHSLRAELNSHGFEQVSLFHFDDQIETLGPGLERVLLEHDLVILSGGVSMGKYDLIPSALADLKVERVFHKVTQRPGKPLWFGKGEKGQIVFGLPGNPVSSLVCLRKYIIPLLKKTIPQYARLSEDIVFDKDLTLFKPINLQISKQGQLEAIPLNFNTSGDYFSLAESHGFIELDREQIEFKAGDSFPIYLWGNQLA